MSIQAVSWALKARVGSSTMKLVLIAISNYADHEGRCWPSADALAADTELSVRSIRSALQSLEDAGFVVRKERRRSDGTQASSLYILNFDQTAEIAPCKQQTANDDASRLQIASEQTAAPSSLTTFEPSLSEPSKKEPSKRAQGERAIIDEFSNDWWGRYPNKVDKPAAQRAYLKARRIPGVTLDILLAGLARYVASKPPDRQWRNPATWLNGHCWADKPAEVLPRAGPPAPESAFSAVERMLREQPDDQPDDTDQPSNQPSAFARNFEARGPDRFEARPDRPPNLFASRR